MEVTAAAFLIAVAMAMCDQLLVWLAQERRSVERRTRALLEAEGIMERLTALPWRDIDDAHARAIRLTAGATDALPGAVLEVRVAAVEDEPALRRVRVQIRWRDLHGGRAAPVRLTAWVARRGEEGS